MATTPTERTSTPATNSSTNIAYRPVYKHWFYKTTSESKRIWIPFSFPDSMLLEEAFTAKGSLILILLFALKTQGHTLILLQTEKWLPPMVVDSM